jgi:hypothetical protein
VFRNNLILVFIIFSASCSPKLIKEELTEVAVPLPNFPNDRIAQGSDLHTNHCIRCHVAKDPKKYTQEELKEIVPRMAVKAKIDAETESKILEYLIWRSE